MDSLVRERRTFIIIQSIILVVMLGFLPFSTASFVSSGEVIQKTVFTPVCGNGVVDDGENSLNCCQDVACGTGYACVNDGEGFSCVARLKEDDTAYQEFVRTGKSLVSQAYDFGKGNQQELLLNLFEKQLEVVEDRGFDVAVESSARLVIVDHIQALNAIEAHNNRLQPVVSSTLYLRVVLEGEVAAAQDLVQLQLVADEAYDAVLLSEGIISRLDDLNTLFDNYLLNTFDFDVEETIGIYQRQQAQFEEVLVLLEGIDVVPSQVSE